MPYADPVRRKQSKRDWEPARHAAISRLRIALGVLEEYGCLWEYERACADAGISDPLAIPTYSRSGVQPSAENGGQPAEGKAA